MNDGSNPSNKPANPSSASPPGGADSAREVRDLAELVAMSEADSRPIFAHVADGRGELYVHEGQVLHATFAGLRGADAVYALTHLLRERGPVPMCIERGRLPIQRTIMLDWQQLRGEASRLGTDWVTAWSAVDEQESTARISP